MASMSVNGAGVAIILAIVLIQFTPLPAFVTLVRLGYGIGKTIQPIADFPYTCRRINHPLLQACEDMWISEATRELYLACSDPRGRLQWFPSVDHYNLTGRSQHDGLVVMSLDQPGLQSQTKPIVAQRLKLRGYSGTAGDGLLDLNGFTGVETGNGVIRFLFANNRPSIDPATGTYAVDQATAGVNATVEIFEKIEGKHVLTHLQTMASPLISTPNRVAAFGDEGFYITNDHGTVKSGGLARLGAMIRGLGDVTFCSYAQGCRVVSSGHHYPNGLLLHSYGRLFVPDSAAGGAHVFQPHENGSLEKLGVIEAFYALDNLSEDSNGDIYAASFPLGAQNMKFVKDPFGKVPPATVLRIRRSKDGNSAYQWEKILEDRDGEVLPAATTVVHDASTGRLFLSGASTPFITVCNSNNT